MRDLSQLSDDELLRATRTRPDAFGVFYGRHVAAVLAYVAHTIRNREESLDLTAEVFAAALAASGRYRPGTTPARGWLFGIARNKLAESRRQSARATVARRRLGIPSLAFTDAALEEIDELIDAQNAGHVEQLATLSPAEREAVTAHVLEERSYADIAKATGASEAAVRQRVSRGLSRLATRAGRRQ